VNIVREIDEIFEFSTDADNVLEWINLYAPVYQNANAANDTDNMAIEEKYSISTK
jgi:hypothetical protein